MNAAKPFLACSLFAFPAVVGLAASYGLVPAAMAAPLGFGLMFTCGTMSLLLRPSEEARGEVPAAPHEAAQ